MAALSSLSFRSIPLNISQRRGQHSPMCSPMEHGRNKKFRPPVVARQGWGPLWKHVVAIASMGPFSLVYHRDKLGQSPRGGCQLWSAPPLPSILPVDPRELPSSVKQPLPPQLSRLSPTFCSPLHPHSPAFFAALKLTTLSLPLTLLATRVGGSLQGARTPQELRAAGSKDQVALLRAPHWRGCPHVFISALPPVTAARPGLGFSLLSFFFPSCNQMVHCAGFLVRIPKEWHSRGLS